jgi:hypothetical protein
LPYVNASMHAKTIQDAASLVRALPGRASAQCLADLADFAVSAKVLLREPYPKTRKGNIPCLPPCSATHPQGQR